MQATDQPTTPAIDPTCETILRCRGVATTHEGGLLQLREEDVHLKSFVVIIDGVQPIQVDERGNRYERLVIEFLCILSRRRRQSVCELTDFDKTFLALVFGESWETRFTADNGAGRPLLKALGEADWLENMVWEG